ncbi:prephenate dehydrogenase [Acetilactobacillus jinshanensis]|uniref:Prephenate dehydrogenase/arogenate dehydrogenase family protein n=1 Tax=Acetilactobacillus jinshanensis TaxID=1720083 RepID=A0A4V1ALP5_9LACO|nr:prephenate dehydrogenase/arogenate dehydrogenase family protein [Acetilactobacillus jinshanensis]QBP18319.1 prephenate dehydrogenase/arogenate dehydrogenase family protein [Acetilactobacillus jinshanensis]URL61184.1 prephenate dehydrogenase/arogenate dehydrogenase family protein [uncultured bacterium]
MKVLVNGTGLIGGSVIRNMRKAHPQLNIIGSDVNKANLYYLLKKHLIDHAEPFMKAASQADVIILATPVNVIIKNLHQLTLIHLKPSVLVTDVGSSKQLILKNAQQLMKKGVHFLGGHPFSGSHLTGSENSRLNLFQQRAYFLVKGNATEKDVKLFEWLMNGSDAIFKMISAEHHDQLLSFMSHLPHVVAFSLIDTIAPQLRKMGIKPAIGAGGIRDTTRIAMGDPKVWASIFNSNSKLITDQINRFEQKLNDFKKIIEHHDVNKMEKDIDQDNHVRKSMGKDKSK